MYQGDPCGYSSSLDYNRTPIIPRGLQQSQSSHSGRIWEVFCWLQFTMVAAACEHRGALWVLSPGSCPVLFAMPHLLGSCGTSKAFRTDWRRRRLHCWNTKGMDIPALQHADPLLYPVLSDFNQVPLQFSQDPLTQTPTSSGSNWMSWSRVQLFSSAFMLNTLVMPVFSV